MPYRCGEPQGAGRPPFATLPAMRNAIVFILGAIVVTTGSVILTAGNPVQGFDDAYISFRYARNLAEGHGPVFNPGERVEGYSNPLFVLLVAPAFFFLPIEAIYYYAVTLNVLCLIAAVAVLIHICNLRFGARAGPIAVAITAASPLLWHAAYSAMETPMVVLGFMLLWCAVTRAELEKPYAGVLAGACVLLVLTRVDGFVMCGVAGLYLMVTKQWRPFITAFVSTVVPLIGITIWRLTYYGYPLPNTYYVKVSGDLDQRLLYAWRILDRMTFIHAYIAVMTVCVVAGVLVMALHRRAPRKLLRFEMFFPVVWMAYWFYIGGDIFKDRFLLPFVPVAAYLVAVYLAPAHGPRWWRVALPAFMIFVPLWWGPYFNEPHYHDVWINAGKYLREHYPNATIAIDGAGKTPYYSNLYTIDTMGLNDPVIAHGNAQDVFRPGHNKTNVEYVLERKPDLWLNWGTLQPGDLAIGLTKEDYTAHGYELTHLFFAGEARKDADLVIDASEVSDREWLTNFNYGYRYLMISRIEED